MARSVCDIAKAVSAISLSHDPEECSGVFAKEIAKFEIDTFACGEVDLRAPARTVFYAIRWPESYLKFYFDSGLLDRDPLLDALRRRQSPFTWSEVQGDGKWPATGTKALQVVAEHGWTGGLVVPIPRGNQRFGLVSLMCRRGPFSGGEKSLLAMLSYCFHERLRNLVPTYGFAIPPMGLSQREIQSLRLIARGATDSDVALELGISRSTAHEHAENAKIKLEVSTRAEAVAVAVSLAIVMP